MNIYDEEFLNGYYDALNESDDLEDYYDTLNESNKSDDEKSNRRKRLIAGGAGLAALATLAAGARHRAKSKDNTSKNSAKSGKGIKFSHTSRHTSGKSKPSKNNRSSTHYSRHGTDHEAAQRAHRAATDLHNRLAQQQFDDDARRASQTAMDMHNQASQTAMDMHNQAHQTAMDMHNQHNQMFNMMEEVDKAYMEGYLTALDEANKYERYMGMTKSQKQQARYDRNRAEDTTRYVNLKNGKKGTIGKASNFMYHNMNGRKIGSDYGSNSYTVMQKGFGVAPENRAKNISSVSSRNIRRGSQSNSWHNIDK